MKTYFITRFSIHDHDFKGFNLTLNNNPKVYEKLLFDKNRLNYKINIFLEFTLPSVLMQSNQNWEFHIYLSSKLPDIYKEKIFFSISKSNKIKLFYVNNFREFYDSVNKFNYSEKFATVRLDDDDILCENFVNLLNKYRHKRGRVISFPNGNQYSVKKGKKKIGEKVSMKNIALGLSGIDMNIYACGDHSDIYKRYEIIYDFSPNVYLIHCSQFCDTQRQLLVNRFNLYNIKFFINNLLGIKGYKIISNKSLHLYHKVYCDYKFINILLNKVGYTLLKIK